MTKLRNASIASLIALAATICGACTSLTTIQSTWTDPTFTGDAFDRIAVLGLFDTTAESRTFEQTAAHALEARGVGVAPAYTLLDDSRMYEEHELREELAAADVDAILIYRLIAVDERNVYRNPTPYLRVPDGIAFGDSYYWYYHPHASYYWLWRSSVDVTRSPGYWESLQYVIVESSLYDAQRDRLVWTARSSTIDDAQFAAVAGSIAERVTEELVASNFIAGSAARRSPSR